MDAHNTERVIAVAALVALAFAAGYFFGQGTPPTELGAPAPLTIISGKETGAVAPVAAETSTVTRVIDGDTVVILGGESVRLIGIDADEKGGSCYEAAKKRLEELVLDKVVTLKPEGNDTDQYGRKLRYLFVDGGNVNVRLVAEGMAVARLYAANTRYRADISAAEAGARQFGVGCEWKTNIKQ